MPQAADRSDPDREPSDLERAGTVVDQIIGRLGGLDVFVQCSGSGHSTLFLDTPLETWRDVLSVDLDGAFGRGRHRRPADPDHLHRGLSGLRPELHRLC